MASVVVPASSRIDPPSGTSATARSATRLFWSERCVSRNAKEGSSVSRSTGRAPPWTRRTTPSRSRAVRSRRTVSTVTPSSSASAPTSTRPWARARSRMASCRSAAYTRDSRRPAPDYGSTVTLMAAPRFTMSKASSTFSSAMCSVMRSFTGTFPEAIISRAALLWCGAEPFAPKMRS